MVELLKSKIFRTFLSFSVAVFLFTGISAERGFSMQGLPEFSFGGPKSVTIIGVFVPPKGKVEHGIAKFTVYIITQCNK